MQIIDGHCHVASTKFIPFGFLEDVAANLHRRLISYGQDVQKGKIVDMIMKQNQDHLADELIAEMNAAGIAETVLLVPDFTQVMACELSIVEMAAEHAHIRARHPGRFRVFLGTDPRYGNQGVDDFEHAVTHYGFDGLKLYPPCGYSPSDPQLFPYYEICAQHGLPVLLHIGPTAKRLDYRYGRPSLIDGASRQFPAVNFILAHGGVSYIEESLDYARYRENIYVDIGGFTGAMHPRGWAQQLRELFRCGVNHKIIFGTDWPIFRMSGGLAKVLAQFRADVINDLPERDVALIMAGNMTRLLPRVPAQPELSFAHTDALKGIDTRITSCR